MIAFGKQFMPGEGTDPIGGDMNVGACSDLFDLLDTLENRL